MAKRLKGYDITSKTMRIGYENCKGYDRSQFQDAFIRYLSSPPILSVTTSQTSCGKGLSVTDSQSAYVTESVHPSHVTKTITGTPSDAIPQFVTDKGDCYGNENLSVTRKPSSSKGCDAVTDKKGEAEHT
jgi:putative DNA primase/helicase